MSKLLKLTLMAAILPVALLVPRAARAGELEEALPESTVVLVKVADWAKTRKDLDATALGKILAEEDVKEYLKGVGQVFDKLVAAMEKKTGVKSADFQAAYGSELALAVLGPQKPTPEEQAARALRANEAAVAGTMRAVATAQEVFKRNDWDNNGALEYARPFNLLHSTKDAEGNALQLIDAAAAAAAGAKGQPKSGYLFQDMKTIGGKAVDAKDDFAVCAIPAEYGKTGKRTFIISTAGTAFAKDLGKAAFVEDFPKDPAKDGWQVEPGWGAAGDAPQFVVALLARVGDEAAAGRVNATIEAALKSIPGSAKKEVTWGGAKGLYLQPERPESQPDFFALRAGAWQMWALGSGQSRARELAEALAAGKCEKSLAASADFKLCRSKLGARADLLWYLGIKKGADQIMTAAGERESAEAAKVLEAIRFGDLVAAAGSVAVEAPGFRSRSFLACKESDDGLVGLLGREPLPPELLKLAPANATGLMAGSFRFDRVLPLVRKGVAAVDKDGAVRMDEGLAEVKKQLGIDVEKDLLGALSGRGCIFAMPGQSVGGNPLLGQINGLVIVAEVKDAAALRGAAAKLVELAKAALAGRGGLPGEEGGGKAAQDMVSTFDYRGQKITSFNLMMVAPGFAITDKYLILGGSVQAVKKAIAQAAGGGEALVDTAAYQKALAAVEGKDATGLSYINTADTVATMVGGAGMVAGMAMPAIAGMREGLGRRGRSSSKNNLRQIGIACHIFADDNDENFPANLLALFPNYVDNKKLYLCPTFAKHAADGVDYVYVAGLGAADPGDTVLAYEPVAGANGMVNVLYADAHVAAVKLEDVKKALEAQAKKLKDNKREMKVLEPKGVEAGAAPPAEALDPELFFDLLKALLNPAAIPAPDSFTKHLFPAASVTRRVEGGILSESYSPLGFAGGPGIGGGGTSVAGVSIIAAIAIPSLLSARRSSLETNAVGSMRAYATAQAVFKRNDWDGDGVLAYAKDFKELSTTKDGAGEPINLIDAAFAAASGPASPKHGYYFVNMKTIRGAAINWATDFALCAVPAVYGRTGFRTFIIDTTGTTYGKDNGGKPVEDYPAEPLKDGWIIAE